MYKTVDSQVDKPFITFVQLTDLLNLATARSQKFNPRPIVVQIFRTTYTQAKAIYRHPVLAIYNLLSLILSTVSTAPITTTKYIKGINK